MEPEYVVEENHRTCVCGYRTRKNDAFWVEDYACWHIVCYNCGEEWVA